MAQDINYSPEQHDSFSAGYVRRLDMNLTDGEKEVMALIAEGRNNEFIAKKLYRSVDAIRSRIKKLYFKLNIDGTKYDKRLKLALMGQEQKEI
jgi:DNA-binding NarL/FixJ family response regulator